MGEVTREQLERALLEDLGAEQDDKNPDIYWFAGHCFRLFQGENGWEVDEL